MVVNYHDLFFVARLLFVQLSVEPLEPLELHLVPLQVFVLLGSNHRISLLTRLPLFFKLLHLFSVHHRRSDKIFLDIDVPLVGLIVYKALLLHEGGNHVHLLSDFEVGELDHLLGRPLNPGEVLFVLDFQPLLALCLHLGFSRLVRLFQVKEVLVLEHRFHEGEVVDHFGVEDCLGLRPTFTALHEGVYSFFRFEHLVDL